MRTRTILGVVACVSLVACASPEETTTQIQAQLLAVDREFAARAQEIGAPKAFVEYAASDVRAFPNGGTTIQGKVSLTKWVQSWPKDAVLQWSPEEAFAARDSSLGYTWGYATFTVIGKDGNPASSHSKYVTIWQKQADGSWKFIADIGNAAPAPDKR